MKNKLTTEEAIALLPATAALIAVYHDVPTPPFRKDTARDEVLCLIGMSEARDIWSGQTGEMLMITVRWRLLFVDIGRLLHSADAPPPAAPALTNFRLRDLLLGVLGGLTLGITIACGLEWMTGGTADPRCAVGVPGYVPLYSLGTTAKEDRVTCVHKVIVEPK